MCNSKIIKVFLNISDKIALFSTLLASFLKLFVFIIVYQIISYTNFSECHGFQIGKETYRVLLNGKNIDELGKMNISELNEFLEFLLKQRTLTSVRKRLLKEILGKTNNLIKFRLSHLSLYRDIPTLRGRRNTETYNNHKTSTHYNCAICTWKSEI